MKTSIVLVRLYLIKTQLRTGVVTPSGLRCAVLLGRAGSYGRLSRPDLSEIVQMILDAGYWMQQEGRQMVIAWWHSRHLHRFDVILSADVCDACQRREPVWICSEDWAVSSEPTTDASRNRRLQSTVAEHVQARHVTGQAARAAAEGQSGRYKSKLRYLRAGGYAMNCSRSASMRPW